YSRIDIGQDGICEHSYGVTIYPPDGSLACIAQRFDCPGFTDLNSEVAANLAEFTACLGEIVKRCEDLGIEPPDFP
ncbi:MAG: hypothetical protein P8Y52_09540, partial [Xanthomonadales bacterium]